MAKKDNVKQQATPAQRLIASKIREARKAAAGWGESEKIFKTALRDSLQGAVDITLTTGANGSGDEVASINEGELPEEPPIDWKAFRAANPKLEKEIKKFFKPYPDPIVRILTTWVEPEQTVPEPPKLQA